MEDQSEDASDQVLAAVLHLRVALAAKRLAVLFDSSRTVMHRKESPNTHCCQKHACAMSPETRTARRGRHRDAPRRHPEIRFIPGRKVNTVNELR